MNRLIMIANPGTHPELAELAQAFADRNFEVHYFSGSQLSAESIVARLTGLPIIRRARFNRQVQRRVLRRSDERLEVHTVGLVLDVLQVIMRRRSERVAQWAITQRNRMVAKAFRRMYRTKRLDEPILIIQHNALAELEDHAIPIDVLNYPIAHHRWAAHAMDSERRENPTWARYLQDEFTTARNQRLSDNEMNNARYILLNSSFVASTFVESGVPAERLLVSPLGWDNVPGGPPLRDLEDFDRESRELRVIYAGQLTQRKGISYMLDACVDMPGVKLTLVGRPVNHIDRRIPESERVKLMHSMPRGELFDEFSRHDVFLMPSLNEGFGLAALEAMGCGLVPVLSTRSFASDVIQQWQNGVVIPPQNSETIRQTLQRLRDDRPLLASMRQAAWKTANQYSWNAYRDRTALLLLAALKLDASPTTDYVAD